MISGLQLQSIEKDTSVIRQVEILLMQHCSGVKSVDDQQPSKELVFQLATGIPDPHKRGRNVNVINQHFIGTGSTEPRKGISK